MAVALKKHEELSWEVTETEISDVLHKLTFTTTHPKLSTKEVEIAFDDENLLITNQHRGMAEKAVLTDWIGQLGYDRINCFYDEGYISEMVELKEEDYEL
tara:strand:+ start:186 stop:485 length:300 start_codon:yes stop_codon:yes gene_type:complete